MGCLTIDFLYDYDNISLLTIICVISVTKSASTSYVVMAHKSRYLFCLNSQSMVHFSCIMYVSAPLSYLRINFHVIKLNVITLDFKCSN